MSYNIDPSILLEPSHFCGPGAVGGRGTRGTRENSIDLLAEIPPRISIGSSKEHNISMNGS